MASRSWRNGRSGAAGLGVALAAVAALAWTASCTSKATEPFRDAPTQGRNGDPAEVIEMPDGFSNVADKCDGHGNRVYVAFKGDDNRAALAVIRDPACETK